MEVYHENRERWVVITQQFGGQYMEFAIKIYGAPYGFDLYDGTEQELNYFQIFDNGSSESVKMTIHRLNSSQTAYNYLRYGYVTSGGRTGSFFGLSVIFNNVYCANFTKFFQLFDAIYSTILQNGILLETLQGQWQAKYKIRKFTEAENEIGRIKGILAQNIQGVLASDIHPIRFAAASSNDKEFRLSSRSDNNKISEALSKYSRVSLSPDYNSPDKGDSGVEVGTIPIDILVKLPREKREILALVKDWPSKVSVFQTDFLAAYKSTNKNVKQLTPRYKSIMNGLDSSIQRMDKFLGNVQRWRKIEPTNTLLNEAQTEVTTSREQLDSFFRSLRLYEEMLASDVVTRGPNPGGNGSEKNNDKEFSIALFIRKHKTKIIAAGVTLLLIVGVSVLFLVQHGGEEPGPSTKPKAPEPPIPTEVNTDSLKEKGTYFYQKKDFVNAYNCFKKAGDSELMKDCQKAYRNVCLNKAMEHKNETVALQYFIDKMNEVDYSPSESDKQSISKSFRKSSEQPPTPKIESTPPKGTIQITGEAVISNNTVRPGKPFTLTFNSKDNNSELEQLEWFIDDKPEGKGKSIPRTEDNKVTRTVKVKFKGKQIASANYTVKR